MMAAGAAGYAWRTLGPGELGRWDERLSSTSASFRQYPFWNESCRRIHFQPTYVVGARDGQDEVFACILALGAPGFRIGLVEKGPVSLRGDELVGASALEGLRAWASRHGYAFLRILAHREQGAVIAGLPNAVGGDGFRLYGGVGLTELLVGLDRDEDALFAGFQTTGRYEIRTAQKLGYEVRRSIEPRDLMDNWRILAEMATRKGLSFPRPPEAWCDVLVEGGAAGRASLYLASLRGRTVQMILVVRDALVAEYMLGALDVTHVERKASPSCLLHWTAIKDARRAGCRHYDLGRPSGPVAQFKRKFRPVERTTLAHYTLVCSPLRYGLWSRLALPAVTTARRRGDALLARLRALRSGQGVVGPQAPAREEAAEGSAGTEG
jgi:hypothetical protein